MTRSVPKPAPATKAESLLVRIFPYNPRAGYHALSFQLSGSPYPPFRVERGWYEVDRATALKLRKQLNNPNDPFSRPIFQVCTRDQAKALERAEQVRVARASDPVPLPDLNARRERARPERARGREVDVDELSPGEIAARKRDAAERGKVIETADEDELAELDKLTEGLGGDEEPEEIVDEEPAEEEEVPEEPAPEEEPTDEELDQEAAVASEEIEVEAPAADLTSAEVRQAQTAPAPAARPAARPTTRPAPTPAPAPAPVPAKKKAPAQPAGKKQPAKRGK